MTKKKNQTTGKPSGNTSFSCDFTTPDYLDIPTKPIEVEKPINGFDYLNALVRIPEVQEDLEKLKESELINKYWGVYGFSPKLLRNPQLFHRHNKFYHNSGAIHVFSNWEFGFTIGNLHFPDSIAEYRDGRHVILALDVTKKKQNIIHEFKELLKRIEKDYNMPKDTIKNKDTTEDIWKIYDYKTKNRLFLQEIARNLSGEKGNSAYNEALDRRVKRVTRAYHKAEKIINTVKQEMEKTIIANQKKKESDSKIKAMLKKMAEDTKKRPLTIADRLLQETPKKTDRR